MAKVTMVIMDAPNGGIDVQLSPSREELMMIMASDERMPSHEFVAAALKGMTQKMEEVKRGTTLIIPSAKI